MATPPTFVTGQVLTAAQMNTIGLFLIKTQTVGTAVPSVTVTNAFSADYDNYLISINGMLSSIAGAALYFQCITSGGAANAANWKGNAMYVATGTGGAFNNGFDNNTVSTACASIDDNPSSANFTVLAPYLTQRTSLHFNSTDTNYLRMGSSILDNATSYPSFLLAPNVGTITGGTIRVYGYRNSL